MQKQYTVEYSLRFRKHSPPEHHHYFTDDPVACEEFVGELLEKGMGLHAIRHDGVDVSKSEFDRIVKLAAGNLAARHICSSLNIKAEEEKYRFGFTD
jgi:hypothetical protein